MCDVDHFKRVNDTYGHQAGDEVLRAVTSLLQAQLRDYDCVGRYGGEEFLLINPGAAKQGEAGLYERLCARVSGAGMLTRRGTISITVSIGVAAATGESTVDTLLADADAALYRAKAEGRNRVAYARLEAAAGTEPETAFDSAEHDQGAGFRRPALPAPCA
jgi:diguanylate cyclase (GGDEF)-like protein